MIDSIAANAAVFLIVAVRCFAFIMTMPLFSMRSVTIVVKVASYNPHPKYKKIIESNRNYKAHDANNECGIGDTVRIIESRPISGGKRWVLESIVEKAK